MGIHVTNTTDGNVIIGPNAEMTENFTYYGVPQENMDYLAKSASEIWPYIKSQIISATTPESCRSGWMRTERSRISKIEIRPELAPHAVNLCRNRVSGTYGSSSDRTYGGTDDAGIRSI